MANSNLFKSMRGTFVPAATEPNREGANAYAYPPKHRLAQYAVTGCLSNTFYTQGGEQLEEILKLAP